MRTALVKVDKYRDLPTLLEYYKKINDELIFNLMKKINSLKQSFKIFEFDQLEKEIEYQGEELYMNMNLSYLLKENKIKFKYDSNFFKEIDYLILNTRRAKPNNREIFIVKERSKPIFATKHITIQPKQINVRTFFPGNTYHELKNFKVNTEIYSEKTVYSKYNNVYMTPNGLENMYVFKKKSDFRKNIEGLTLDQVKKIAAFPNKYEEPLVKNKLLKLLSEQKMDIKKFKSIKKSYVQYIRTNNILKHFQKRVGKNSYLNPLYQTIYYKIFVNSRTYYYIPDIDMLTFLINRYYQDNSTIDEHRRKDIRKILRIINIQNLLLEKRINHRIILNKAGLLHLLNDNNDKKIIYTRFSHNDMYFFKYLFEELKINREVVLMRNPNISPFDYSVIKINKEKQYKTFLITYNSRNKLNFFVKQAVIEENMPDVKDVISQLNSQYISQNENNYRKMIISDLLKLNDYRMIRAVFAIDSLTKNDQGLYKAYNYIYKKETGLVTDNRRIKMENYEEMMRYVCRYKIQLKEIKDEFMEENYKYNDFKISSMLYNCSIYAVIKKDVQNKVIPDILQNKIYQTYCKPLINNKLIVIVYPLLMNLLILGIKKQVNIQNKNLINKLQESVKSKKEKLEMLTGDLNKYQEQDKTVLIKKIEQTQIELKNRQNDYSKNLNCNENFVGNLDDLFQFSVKELVDVKKDKKNATFKFKTQLETFELLQFILFLTFKLVDI